MSDNLGSGWDNVMSAVKSAKEIVLDNQTQASKVLAGAAIGAGFAFLFLTRSGHRFLDSAEP